MGRTASSCTVMHGWLQRTGFDPNPPSAIRGNTDHPRHPGRTTGFAEPGRGSLARPELLSSKHRSIKAAAIIGTVAVAGRRSVITGPVAVVIVIRFAPLLGSDRGPHGPDHHPHDREARSIAATTVVPTASADFGGAAGRRGRRDAPPIEPAAAIGGSARVTASTRWDLETRSAARTTAMTWFLIQLALSGLWSPVFFGVVAMN
jgi:hypothetical protein